MTRRATFKQSDLERAIRAAKAVGETRARVDIAPDGTISVLLGVAPAPQESLSPLQAWKLKNGRDRAA